MKAKKQEAVAINSSIPWKERGKRLAEIDDEIEACDKHKKELERAVFFKFLLGALASAVTGIAVTAIAPAVAPALGISAVAAPMFARAATAASKCTLM